MPLALRFNDGLDAILCQGQDKPVFVERGAGQFECLAAAHLRLEAMLGVEVDCLIVADNDPEAERLGLSRPSL